ncbi:MAG TPA: ABC transporter ATP-binding protein [Desulfobulbaceae bacterium]|nr:ABC transporter ATP-binding protein [Desulfobulbaceae bacterium]
MIQVERISKYYNRNQPDEVRALSDIHLTIAAGEALVVNGASGCGKTTLLGLVGCMSRPTSGSVLVDGRDVSRLPERFLGDIRRRTFGFIFQQLNLIKSISVLENTLLPLYPGKLSMKEMKIRAEEILARFDLNTRAGEKVSRLSGGEQQRVAIARALIHQPQVIIADEPTAHLDSVLAAELLDILSGLNREGKTVLIATHDPFVSNHSLIDRVIRMRDGRIID